MERKGTEEEMIVWTRNIGTEMIAFARNIEITPREELEKIIQDLGHKCPSALVKGSQGVNIDVENISLTAFGILRKYFKIVKKYQRLKQG